MSQDPVGDRMKGHYERRAQTYLLRRTHTIIRLDGKAFHTYTRGLDRPYDKQLMDDMAEAARYGVDFMTEGEILVRGTLDPHEALKILFEENPEDVDWRLDDRLYEVARPREGISGDPEPTKKAVDEFADWLHELLANPHCRYWRKVNCLPSSYGEFEGWSWALHPAERGKPGAFPGVEFVR